MITPLLRFLGCFVLVLGIGTAWAEAATINFDDLNASAGDIILDSLSPCQGFTWSNFSVYTTTLGFPGFNNGIISHPNAAYSGGQSFGTAVTPITGTITAATPFDFVSAYLGSGYYDNLNVTVEGLLNGTVVYRQTVTVSTSGAQQFNFGFDGVNEVDLFSSTTASSNDPYACGSFNCTQFTLDDLTLAASSGSPPPPSSSVPEPSTTALESLGGLTIVLLYRHKKGGGRW